MTSAYGRFQLVGPLAAGSLGTVDRAVDAVRGRDVAIKSLHPVLAANPDARMRFSGAAYATARVSHPNLVRIIQSGEQDGLPFVCMELIDGPTLAALMQGGRSRSLQQTVALIAGLAGAIDALHDVGMTHAAVRPDHVLVAPPMHPVLLGIDPFGGVIVPGVVPADGRFDVYRMPPEIAAGGVAVPATDIYQLGAIAYQLLSGQKPYGDAADPAAMRARVLAGPPTPLRSLFPGLPDNVYQAIDRALSPDPSHRFTKAAHFAGILNSSSSSTASASPIGVEMRPSPIIPGPPPDISMAWAPPGTQPAAPPAWPAPSSTLAQGAQHTAAGSAPAWPETGTAVPGGSPPWSATTTGVPGAGPPPPINDAGATAAHDMPPVWSTRAAPPPPPLPYSPPDATVMAAAPQRRSRRGLLIALGLGTGALAAGAGAAAYLLLFGDDAPAVSTVAGTGEPGFADGTGGVARFNQPNGIAGDGKGNFFVADIVNFRVRKVASDGVVTTHAGSGEGGADNGPAAKARFNQPYGVAVDKDGNVYVADYGNFLLRKISPGGDVSTLAGSGQRGFADGEAYDAKFGRLAGVAVDRAGNAYVVDTENHAVRKVSPSGSVSTLAGNGSRGDADGTGEQARFNSPLGLAVDKDGNLYVADTDNNRIRKVTPAGVVTTLAGDSTAGFADGNGGAARFNHPAGIAVDGSGNVFVADRDNHRIRKVTPAGIVTTVAGAQQSGWVDGSLQAARFSSPTGVAVGANGVLWVTDRANHRIRRIKT